MKINNQEITSKFFAYDGCHKIYILENENEINEAKEIGYSILDIKNLKDYYYSSCPLRFIDSWNFSKRYVPQCQDAIFED